MRTRCTQALLIALMAILPLQDLASQGTPIVDNQRPLWKSGEGLALAPTAVLVIGTQVGPMYEFSRVVGAARMRDGRVVVADGASRSLRFFDATGRFLKSAGGPGEGPGEFQRLESFWLLEGDTIVAGSTTGDLSYFAGSGAYLARRGVRQPPIPLTGSGRPVVLLPLDGSGRRVVAAMPRPNPKESRAWFIDSFPVAIVDPGNAVGVRLGDLPALEQTVNRGEQRMARLGSRAVFAAGGGKFFLGYGGEYAVRVFNADGRSAFTIRRAWRPILVSNAVIDKFVDDWGKLWITATGSAAEAERADLRGQRYAKQLPAFAQFIVDRAGQLWVRQAELADAPGTGAFDGTPLVSSQWSVFDKAGRWLGNVAMPPRFMPHDIGTDYILGTARDDDSVESIVVYALASKKR